MPQFLYLENKENTHPCIKGCLKINFSDSSVGKESTYNAGNPSLIHGLGRSPGEEIGYLLQYSWASLVAQLVKESACNEGDLGSVPRLGRSPGEGKGYPPGEFHGLYSLWGCKESDMTEQLSLHLTSKIK